MAWVGLGWVVALVGLSRGLNCVRGGWVRWWMGGSPGLVFRINITCRFCWIGLGQVRLRVGGWVGLWVGGCVGVWVGGWMVIREYYALNHNNETPHSKTPTVAFTNENLS